MQWNLSDLTWLCVFWISSLLLFMLSTPQSHHSGCREITNDDESFWYGWRMRFVEWSLLYHTSEGTYPLLYSTYCSRFFLSGPIKPWCVHIECILGNSSVWDDPRAVHMFFFHFFDPKSDGWSHVSGRETIAFQLPSGVSTVWSFQDAWKRDPERPKQPLTPWMKFMQDWMIQEDF